MAETTVAPGGGGGPNFLIDAKAGLDKTLSSESVFEAANFVNQQVHRVKHTAEEGHWSFRVFSFFGGCTMIVTSVFDWVNYLLHLAPIHALIAFYVVIFGIMTCILEGRRFLPITLVVVQQKRLHEQARFLKFVWGRGILYFFAGSLQFSHMTFLNMISGGFMMFLGVASIIIGRNTAKKLALLKASITDEEVLRNLFNENDVNGDGLLTQTSFASLVNKLGLQLNYNELEAAFSTIDKDNDQRISYEDFKVWWTTFDSANTTKAQFGV